ncbi:MAG: hypothetical protein HYZ28_19690 [Myxococcales bacterium]|nr:hypothetical protein [Myxococcales bacterium]
MRAALLLPAGAVCLWGCVCARVPDALFACEADGGCQSGQRCVSGLCLSADACVPRLCPEGACGTADDGCGALADCGGCPSGQACGAGEPDASVPNRCGSCTVTDLADFPDDSFFDSNCDGVDGDAKAAVFVDAAAGNDAFQGTMAQPVRTIAAGLQRASERGTREVYLSQGIYSEDLTIQKSVSLYGGYAASRGWSREPNPALTAIRASAAGTILSDFAQSALLERLTLSAADAVAPGAPSVALTVKGAAVSVRHAVLSAGAGAAGQNGSDGASGADGPDGGPGMAGTVGSNPAVGGRGGVQASCAGANGGDGGAGGYLPSARFGGENGESAEAGPSGGQGGAPVYCSSCSGQSCASWTWGGEGADGQSGSNAGPGTGGGGGSGPGKVVGEKWAPASGKVGLKGGFGQGGGGGGGGGTFRSILGCAGNPDESVNGASGGGGGAGGCGGEGGAGGEGGGASIGVLVLSASPSFEEVVVKTSNGGAGGAGGRGGQGGRGGAGGSGGAAKLGPAGGEGGGGGQGGSGGAGGRGGHGGGGAGGPSVGLFCSPGSPALRQVTFQLGLGGAGGASSGSRGEDRSSRADQLIGCQ